MEIDLARFLDALPGLVWSTSPIGRAEHAGNRWLEYTGLTFEQALGAGWTAALHPDDAPGLLSALAKIVASGERYGELDARLRRRDGAYRWHRTFVTPLHDAAGANELWYGVSRDIEDAKRADAKLAAEKHLLELVAKGGPLGKTLDALCRQVEELADHGVCGILLVDAQKGTFRTGAAPNLPDEYSAVLEGRRIEPTDAPSALAVSLKAPVIVADLSQDARWATSPLPQRLIAHGLRSCWSMPILSGGGDVLGVFAAYHPQVRRPTKEEHELIERFAHIAGIAIERDQAETALKTSEAELRLAHDQLIEAQKLSKTGSSYWNVEGDEHHCSEEWYRIFELHPSTPVTVDLIRDLVHPEDREQLEAAIARGSRGQGFSLNVRVQTASGALKHVRVVARLSDQITDRPTFVGAIQDVTETKLTEAALRAREAELRLAHDQLTEAQKLSKTGSFHWDVETALANWSEEAYRILEVDPSTVLTEDLVRDLVHPEDRGALDAALALGASTGQAVSLHLRAQTASGALKHVRVFARRGDIADRPTFVGAIQDVTETKLAEAALRSSEAELRQAHDQLAEAQKLSKTGSFLWDAERDAHDWSEEVYRIFEVDPSTRVTADLVRDLIHPEDRGALEAGFALGGRGQAFSLNLRTQTASGALKHLRVFARPSDPTADRPTFVGAVQDVTETKLVEAALRSSEAELRQAHDQLTAAQHLSKTGSFLWDVEKDEHVWSEELFRIAELDPSTPVSWDLARELVCPEDHAALEAAFALGVSGKAYAVELRMRTASGALKHLQVVARPSSYFADRRVIFGAVQDVTEAKHAEAALKSSEAELRRAYDSLAEAQRLSKTGSFITDLVADDHNWSDEAYRIFDFDPAAPVTIESIRALVHPDDLSGFDSMIAKALTGADVDFVFRVVTGKGALKHVHGLAHVVERVAGRPKFVGALQDVTESKLIEEALRSSEAELRRANRYLTEAQKLSKTGSFSWDVNADEHDWSDEQRRIWEFDATTRITMSMILSAVHPDDLPLAEAVIGQAMAGAARFELIFRIITKSGALKHLHCVGHPVEQVRDRPVFLGAIQDITERKAAEEALRESQAELLRVMRLTTIGELVASITHEITQPLTAIASNGRAGLNWLGRETPNVDRARNALQRIDRDVQHAGGVIQSLRALVTKSGPNRAWVEVGTLVDEVLVLVANQLRNRNVRVVTDLGGDVAPIFADRVQLQQVILNLVVNGAEAMDSAEAPRVLTIASSAAQDGGVHVSVADTGPGMDPATAERVFDSFFTTKSSGMGMGLSICRSIISAHGGRIWVEPNTPHGAIFQFTVPPGNEAAEPAGEPTPERVSAFAPR